ncbi:MAG: hypothetical protein QW735_01235 [archaeon]
MKGQGALEYLVLIVAILVIAGVVVFLITSSGGAQSKTALFNSCKQAALECKLLRQGSPNDPCKVCDVQCVDSSGKDIMAPWGGSAITCCKKYNFAAIYEGSKETCG